MLPDVVDVLLVEDSPLEVELLLRSLSERESGRRAGVARDGEEALDYLLGRGTFRERIVSQSPRVVLLGLKLPKMDGVEVLRVIRSSPRTAAVPVVMLLPSADPRELAQCYQLGANSCVCKPVNFHQFRDVIRALAHYWLGINQVPPI